ncbi:MAG: VOC family protein [Oscillospiraceae bacterium]
MNRINLICLGVRDMQKALAFYKSLGFKTYIKEQNPPIVFFDTQGTKLELYPIEGFEPFPKK